MQREGPFRQGSGPIRPAGTNNEAHHHPLDDDPELERIARFSPPEIDVAPDSVCHEGYDAPPPMIRPADGESKPSRIEHIAPLSPLAQRAAEEPLSMSEETSAARKIKAFEQKLGGGGHDSKWKRRPNVTGTGAIHVKSFHCKLTGDSLEFLDMQVNQWLDEHPEYEVKMVTTSIGEWTGKLKEPALIVNVWV